MSDSVGRARQLVARGDVREAAGVLKAAEQAGDPAAARELAEWCLAGQLVRRDLAAARSFFERAADLGDRSASAIVRAFVAGGIGGPADWTRAMQMLVAAAATDARAAAELEIIGKMVLAPDDTPIGEYPFERLSDAPDVRLFRNFFSDAECTFLASAAEPLLAPSSVVDPQSGALIANPVRTSDAAGLPLVLESPAIHALCRRIARASGTHVRQGEPLQVLRYRPGQQYRPHVDALPTSDNQRIITFLVWLNEGYEGGETRFEHSGLEVKGRTGDALMFSNVTAAGLPDGASQHSGLPVTRGKKLIASRWIRQRPLVG